MRCPACGAELVAVEREGVEVDWCPFCRGLWFDQGELELLAEAVGCALRLPQGEALGPSPRPCPRCRRALQVQRLQGEFPLRLEHCPAGHGWWLDQGELSLLSRRIAEGRTSPELITFLGEKLVPRA